MAYLIPDQLSDSFGYLFYRHASYATFMMEVPLKIYIRDIAPDAPDLYQPGRPHKAQTYADVIEFSEWYVKENAKRPEHLAFVLAHEIGHQMLQHSVVHHRWASDGFVTGRATPTGKPVTYPFVEWVAQHAFDFQVNHGLVLAGLPMPKEGFYDPAIGTMFDLEESIYVRYYEAKARNLPPQSKPSGGGQAKGQPQPGGNGDERGEGKAGSSADPSKQGGKDAGQAAQDGQGNDADAIQQAPVGCGGSDVRADDGQGERIDALERRRNAFVKALASIDPAKLRGYGDGSIEKLIERIYPKRVKWTDMVRPRFLSSFGGRTPTWQRLDRRAWAKGYSLPGRVTRQSGTLVVVLDTSGSMSAFETAHCIAQLIPLCKQTQPKHLIVLEVDDCVQRVTEVKRFDDLRRFIDPIERGSAGVRGNGGTDMRHAHNWLIKNDVHPEVTLYFTDGGTSFPTDKGNSTAVYWIMTTAVVAPKAAGPTVRLLG